MDRIVTRTGNVAIEIRGKGPPLFLLHSVGHDHRDYDFVVSRLAERFQTIAVDWPGHGESEMWSPPAAACVATTCGVLEDIVDALDLPPATFLGNSLGGAASIWLAARRPGRVRALVLVDSGGSAEPSALLSALCWVQGREVVRRWTGLAFARAYLKIRGPNRDLLLARIAEQRRRPGFVEMDAALWRSFGTPENDMANAARAIRAATLVVWGERDPVIRAKVEGKRLCALIPNAEYVGLPTGHVPFVEAPEAFLDAVMPFLERTADTGSHACPASAS